MTYRTNGNKLTARGVTHRPQLQHTIICVGFIVRRTLASAENGRFWDSSKVGHCLRMHLR